MVEEYLAKAGMTGWVAERMLGGESLILKEEWVFDEGGFGLLRDGHLSVTIARVAAGKSIYRLGSYYG